MKRRITKKSTEDFINMAENITEVKEIKAVDEKTDEPLHVEESLEELDNNNENNLEDECFDDATNQSQNVDVKVNLYDEDEKLPKRTSKNRWKRLKSKRHGDHPLVGLGLGENGQWGSMETLGIYGLLTPAVAAVPVSEEVCNFHL